MGIRHPEQGFAWFVLDCSSVYVKTMVYQPVVGTMETASGILSKDLPGLYLIVPLGLVKTMSVSASRRYHGQTASWGYSPYQGIARLCYGYTQFHKHY